VLNNVSIGSSSFFRHLNFLLPALLPAFSFPPTSKSDPMRVVDAGLLQTDSIPQATDRGLECGIGSLDVDIKQRIGGSLN
jgi:hypothetical protein